MKSPVAILAGTIYTPRECIEQGVILIEGSRRAQEEAERTMTEVRKAVGVGL